MLEKLMSTFELITDFTMETCTKILDLQENIIKKITDFLNRFFNIVLDTYQTITTSVYTFFRWSTIPFNYIIKRTWLWYVFKTNDDEPLDETGVHYVRARPGGGKSMLAYQKANETLEKHGYPSYMTHPIEKPKLTEDKKFWYVDHRLINLRNYFDAKGNQTKLFNTDMYKQMHIDEFHIENNPRRNKEKEYNAFFIPFLNQLLSIRHDGFDYNIYIYSQIPNNDIQLMSTITKYHEVKLIKGLPYWKWIKDGKFVIVPIKWKIKTFDVEIGEGGSIKRKLYRAWSKKVDYDKLEYFETHAMRGNKRHLPLDYEKRKVE